MNDDDRELLESATKSGFLGIVLPTPGVLPGVFAGKVAQKLQATNINFGLELSARLAKTPSHERSVSCTAIARDVLSFWKDKSDTDKITLVRNLEAMFSKELEIDPVECLKSLARRQRLVAIWPGELRDDRLVYGGTTHREHRTYSQNGLVTVKP